MTKELDGNCDVCVVGGAGHVGVPLSLVLANNGFKTLVVDVNRAALEEMAAGRLPFFEQGGEAVLRKVLAAGNLAFSSEAKAVGRADFVVVTIGTPIDEFHNPELSKLTRCFDELIPHLRDDQTIILRSTVAPGTTTYIDNYLRRHGKKTRLAFCPERVVQGKGVQEIPALPQLISGTSAEALEAAKKLFSKIAPEVVEMSPLEAEFAKLICNAFRYIEFAATNQLYMMVERAGLDYCELHSKMKRGYPRMERIPGPGFAAGPCLMKDTMQLFAFQKHDFILGQVAMTINEGLPNFIVERLAAKFDLSKTRVGILGMAFKAESDDIRESLSYKLGKLLRFHGAKVFYSDEYAKDPTFVDKQTLVRECDVIIVGVPHNAYRSLDVPRDKNVVDLWSALPKRDTASAK
jgi:UDP-N-acetyl-D-mannosaminuronic acid dehydrogenase